MSSERSDETSQENTVRYEISHIRYSRSSSKATIKRVKHKVYFNVFQRAKWFRKTKPLLIISLRYGRYDREEDFTH